VSFWRSAFTDERDNPSMGRLLVTAVLVFAGWFTVQDIRGQEVGQSIYDFWLPIALSLIAWAAGPRMVQYLAPAAQAAVNRLRGMVSRGPALSASPDDDDPVPPGPVRLE